MTGRCRPVAVLLGVARSTPALRSRSFRLLASGQFVSNVGDGLYAVALPWYVLAHHGGPILLGAVLACYGIPRTCLIMVGGHLADRIGPWRVMMGADLGRLVIAAALAVLAATRQPSLLTLAPIAFGLGAGEGLFLPASFSIMPRLVRRGRTAEWQRAAVGRYAAGHVRPGRRSAAWWSPPSVPRPDSGSTR